MILNLMQLCSFFCLNYRNKLVTHRMENLKFIQMLSYYLVNTVRESFKIIFHMNVLNTFTVLHPSLGIGNPTNIITEMSVIPQKFKADSVNLTQIRL
jgi:hypothetical protein